MILAVFSIVPLYFVDVMIPYYYRSSMIKDRKADLQTKAAVVAGEYADYESLAEAENMAATPIFLWRSKKTVYMISHLRMQPEI